MAYEVFGECNHDSVLWGKAPTYEEAVAIAEKATGDKSPFKIGETLVWGDLNYGVFAEIEEVG